MSKPHHWSADRYARKMRMLDFIQTSIGVFPDGVPERKIMQVMSKQLRSSPELVKKYLEELENTDYEIEKIDDNFFPVGYEKPSKDEEKASS